MLYLTFGLRKYILFTGILRQTTCSDKRSRAIGFWRPATYTGVPPSQQMALQESNRSSIHPVLSWIPCSECNVSPLARFQVLTALLLKIKLLGCDSMLMAKWLPVCCLPSSNASHSGRHESPLHFTGYMKDSTLFSIFRVQTIKRIRNSEHPTFSYGLLL